MPSASKPWTATDDAVLFCNYCEGGATACMPLLPERTRVAIRRRAFLLKIAERNHDKYLADHREPWPLPTMGLLESLDCVRLRQWRGPVRRADQLVASL